MPLSDATCRAVKPRNVLQKLSDSGGLQLWVQPNGSRLWRYAYRFGGKQKLLALGIYPEVSLLDARHARDEARKMLRDGVDPSRAKKLAKLSALKASDTFGAIAAEYVEKLRREGRSDATINKIEWLLSFALPTLGSISVANIHAAEILLILRSVEVRGRFETARRLRSTIGAILRYAVVTGRENSDPTVTLRGALTAPVVKPRAAITDPKALGGLLRAIDGFDGQPTTHAALKLMALLFPRPGEMRAAEWSEFDMDAAIWTIPAKRMKMRRPHRVPLPKQALATLRKLQVITGNGNLVFPSVRTVQRPISEGTLNAALRRLDYSKDEMSSHGFRAAASTLLNESGIWNADAIERQLGHIESNSVRRAYARGEHWNERVNIMAWWADKLDELKSVEKVVSLKRELV